MTNEHYTIQEKLHILADAAKYDVACTSSGSSRRGQKGELGNAVSGSGLGLSIVRTLVESWGGSVSLENLHDGGKTGLRARVRFPA